MQYGFARALWRTFAAVCCRLRLVIATGVFVIGAEAQSEIQSLVVPNGSFELPASTDGNYRWTSVNGDSTTIPNWTYNIFGTGGGGGGGAQNSINAEFPATTGTPGDLDYPGLGLQYGWLNVYGDSDLTVTFTSVSIVSIQPWSRYRLTVALGDRINEDPAEAGISLLANGNLIPGTDVWMSGSQLREGEFYDVSSSFDVLGPGDPLIGQPLKVRLMHHKPLVAGSSVHQANFDNVRLEAEPIPELNSAISLVLSALVCGMGRRSRGRMT